jgi:acetoacetyl-CoA synthetase
MEGMTMDGTVLWSPKPDAWATTNMGRLIRAMEHKYDLKFDDYESFRAWTVDNIETFYAELAEAAGVIFHDAPTAVLTSREIPGARWFADATLNYAENLLAGLVDGLVITAVSETRERIEVSADELRDQVARIRAGLIELGVGRGDRVGAYLPHIPETIAAFLATASLGAIWAVCPPEFGVTSVVDRLSQVAPKVLLAVDGYRYAGKSFDRRDHVPQLIEALPSVESTVWLPYLFADAEPVEGARSWYEVFAKPAEMDFEPVPFDHPLYVLFTSGTTGLPKAVPHSHGGPLIEHYKWLALMADLHREETFFWYSTTGWMVWNLAPAALAVGARIVIMDGSPTFPGLEALWALVEDLGVNVLGASTGYVLACAEAGLRPGSNFDLSQLRSAMIGGSPLTPDGWEWWYREVRDDILVGSPNGGTDLVSTYVGGCPLVPVRSGRQACVYPGVHAEARDAAGRRVIEEPGELVVTTPIPTMPAQLWGDEDGSKTFATYYETFPGVYDQHDWVIFHEDGSWTVLGRSDATLNRGGVRLGPSEFYVVTSSFDEIAEAAVVHVQKTDHRDGQICLFLLMNPGYQLDDDLRTRIKSAISQRLSPRHVPDLLEAVPDLPRTLSGKLLEIPIRRILEGAAPESVVSAGALANPAALNWFIDKAHAHV